LDAVEIETLEIVLARTANLDAISRGESADAVALASAAVGSTDDNRFWQSAQTLDVNGPTGADANYSG
jgi:hypothetical protein